MKKLPRASGHRLHRGQRRALHLATLVAHHHPAETRRHAARRTPSTSTRRPRSSLRRRRRRCVQRMAEQALPRLQDQLRHQPQDPRRSGRRLPQPRATGPSFWSCRVTRPSSAASLDVPVRRFTADCRALARKKDAQWISLVERGASARPRLLRSLAPRRTRSRGVAGSAVEGDGETPRAVRHGGRRVMTTQTPARRGGREHRSAGVAGILALAAAILAVAGALAAQRRRMRLRPRRQRAARPPRATTARAAARCPARTPSTACRSSPICAPSRRSRRWSSSSEAPPRARAPWTTPRGPPTSRASAARR